MLAPAQLQGAWVHSTHFVENEQFDASDPETVFYTVSAHVTHDPFEHDEARNETWAVAHLNTTIEWRRENDDKEDDRPGPFELKLVVAGVFTWPRASVDERFCEAWLEYNAHYLLWPYLRSYASAITSMSRLPPLTIYTLTVPEPPDFESEEDVRVTEEASQPE